MIHKVIFMKRQRRTVSHFSKYVIKDADIERLAQSRKKSQVYQESLPLQFKKICSSFDPEDNKWDRRLLYEVTGIRLYDNEFRESDSSDEDGGGILHRNTNNLANSTGRLLTRG